MTSCTIEFKVYRDTVYVSVDGSSQTLPWSVDKQQAAVFEAIDRLPWTTSIDGTPEVVREAGRAVRAKLDEVPGLQPRLQGGFATAPPAQHKVVLRVASPDVERVPFEVLFDETSASFAALEGHWSLTRLPADCDARPLVATIPPRLRLLAVVAARGIEPDAEIRALREAVGSIDGLDIDVRVLTNRRSGVDMAKAAGWSAEFVRADVAADAIVDQIVEFGPQLLHLFCHGTSEPPQIQIGLKDDLDEVEIGAEVLRDVMRGPPALGPWLVTLNCCEGAAASTETTSLAGSLVRCGFPAVIGMRAPIDTTVASRFCSDLYRSVLGRLAELRTIGRAIEPLDWGSVLQQPRRRLVTFHGGVGTFAGRQKEWTMPVVYVGADRFLVRGQPTTELPDEDVGMLLMTLASFDAFEHGGAGMPSAEATAMRRPTLDRLYG